MSLFLAVLSISLSFFGGGVFFSLENIFYCNVKVFCLWSTRMLEKIANHYVYGASQRAGRSWSLLLGFVCHADLNSPLI